MAEENQREITCPSKDISHFSSLNECRYLYVRNISEPRDNSLLLIVEETVGDLLQTGSLPTDGPISQWVSIESTETCRKFKLHWKHYVAYLVTEECVGSCGEYEDEVHTGKLLRHYTKSHFLEHLARDTGGHLKHIQHYKLICLNHLIDVASEEPPEIEILSPTR
jgi:hypothetical protein